MFLKRIVLNAHWWRGILKGAVQLNSAGAGCRSAGHRLNVNMGTVPKVNFVNGFKRGIKVLTILWAED